MPTTAKTRFDSLEQEAFLNLWRTYDRLRMHEDELFADFDLTAQQYNVLRLLKAADQEVLPTLAIAQRLVSRAPDITRMLDKLEQRELIRRDRSTSDRRSVLIGLTPAGRSLLVKIDQPLRRCHERQLGHMPPDRLKKLVELLREARRPHEADQSPWKS